MPRATKAEHEQRIEQVCRLLIQAAQRRDVITWATPRWGVGERQLDKYIAAAQERIAQSLPGDRTYEIALSLRRHTFVYGQAMKDGKLTVAEKALEGIDRLLRRSGGDGSQQPDIATIRKNLTEIATELFKTGELDEIG
jgi:hypothetical protein